MKEFELTRLLLIGGLQVLMGTAQREFAAALLDPTQRIFQHITNYFHQQAKPLADQLAILLLNQIGVTKYRGVIR